MTEESKLKEATKRKVCRPKIEMYSSTNYMRYHKQEKLRQADHLLQHNPEL